MTFKRGDKVKVVNKNLSCYGAVGEIYAVANLKGETYYAIKVTPEEARRIYPDYPANDDFIWQFFKETDLEKYEPCNITEDIRRLRKLGIL